MATTSNRPRRRSSGPASRRFGLAAGAVLVACIVGCGENEAPPRYATVLGDSPTGAPTGHGPIDTGILSDQKAYQPAKRSGGPVDTGDAGEQARAFVEELLARMQAGEILPIIDAYGDQARGLEDVLIELWDTEEQLLRAVADKFGEVEAAQLRTDRIERFRTEMFVEPVTADRVNVTPDFLGRVLFGPLAPGVMAVVKTDETWGIRLDQPLTEEQIGQVVRFHEQKKSVFNQVAESIEDGTMTEIAAVRAALQAADPDALGSPEAPPAEAPATAPGQSAAENDNTSAPAPRAP